MKYTFITACIFSLFSCSQSQTQEKDAHPKTSTHILDSSFTQILNSADFDGTILIYDSKKDTYISNDFLWAETGFLPASTFKIPNSIIALELGLIQSDSSILKWNGKLYQNSNWNQDLKFREAFHLSCVPCYQELARKVGVENMQQMLNSLGYNIIKIDSANLDNFWLVGNSHITCFQQINFLKRFYNQELPIKSSTYTTMKSVIVRDTIGDAILSGKTGWSGTDTSDNGWFIGYVETKNNVHYFATNVTPRGNRDPNEYYETRVLATLEALMKLKIILP